MTRRLHPQLTIIASILVAACGGSEKPAASDHPVTAATLDSLPSIALAEGGRVCIADGRSLCPLRAAVANWLAPDQFALWEPGAQVSAWRVGDTTGVPIGGLGQGPGKYANPSAVGATSDGEFLIVDAQTDSLLRYDGRGSFLGAMPLPRLFGLTAWGFAGRLPVLQRITATDSLAPATLELKLLKTAGDSAGRIALQVALPWLRLADDAVAAALPLFLHQPAYGIGTDGSVTWSSGDRFWIRRINSEGGTDWTLTSDITGPAITPAQLAARRKEMESVGVAPIDLDSMAARTPATYAAVSGILTNHDGRTLIARAIVPGNDSMTYVMLSKDGTPLSRLTLGTRVHPLLLTGDSLLVHRPTESEQWEVSWLLLTGPR